ncbi:hypothetical protein EYF80_065359 [Liparis tanakae]|uniref:Uncharacterized protein n=1 Tax=Liparis tanakae TaxID=230148 RepID=A0A4Z2E6V6_9TELE|nr:hypothetical protein EYF80_065359 [Liparis tanakae]
MERGGDRGRGHADHEGQTTSGGSQPDDVGGDDRWRHSSHHRRPIRDHFHHRRGPGSASAGGFHGTCAAPPAPHKEPFVGNMQAGIAAM